MSLNCNLNENFHMAKKIFYKIENKQKYFQIKASRGGRQKYVVVVYHVTNLASGHGLLNNLLPLLISCVLCTAGSSDQILCRPVYFVRTTQLLPYPGHEY